MRVLLAVLVGAIALGGVAEAQTPAAANDPGKGYVEVVAASAFGNVTSQSYGAEIGVTVAPMLQLFVDGGQVRDVATADISTSAQLIAGALAQSYANVGFSVKEPVTFFGAGARFLIPPVGRAQPYVTVGVGAAKVKQDVKFTIAGSDVTSSIDQYGVTLGTDLKGDFTKPMITAGAGVAVTVWKQMIVDLQIRYGRILAEDGGINVTRAGLGIGFKF
jgi:opacity protein-like surface antigen